MDDSTVVLTQEQQAIVNAVVDAVDKRLAHDCFFDESSRKKLHDLVDAIDDEGATRETHIIVFRIGNGVRTACQKIAQGATWGVMLLVCVIIAILFGRSVGWPK